MICSPKEIRRRKTLIAFNLNNIRCFSYNSEGYFVYITFVPFVCWRIERQGKTDSMWFLTKFESFVLSCGRFMGLPKKLLLFSIRSLAVC